MNRMATVIETLTARPRPAAARWALVPLRLIVGYGFMEHGLAPAIDRLAQFFTMYGRLILSELGVCLALISDRSLNPPSRRRLRSLKKQFEITVRKILDDGRQDGTISVDDPKVFAFAIFGAFNWALQWFSNKGSSSPDQVIAAMFEIFRKVATQKSPCD
jgi:hypothetical protein